MLDTTTDTTTDTYFIINNPTYENPIFILSFNHNCQLLKFD